MNSESYNLDVIEIVGFAASVLSLLGCLFMIVSYLTLEELRKIYISRLTFHLGIVDLVVTLNGVITLIFLPNTIVPWLCWGLGMIREYIIICSFLWPFIFGYVLYQFHTGNYTSPQHINMNFNKYLWFAYGVPVIFAVIPTIVNGYGSSIIFCWLGHESATTFNRLEWICFYIPIIILTVITLYFILRIICSGNPAVRKHFGEIILFPIVLLLSFLFIIMEKVFDLDNSLSYTAYLALHLVARQSMGFFNFLAYGFTPKVRQAIRMSRVRNNSQDTRVDLSLQIMKPPTLSSTLSSQSFASDYL